MLINEAKWLGEALRELPIERNSVILNFGSQTFGYNKNNSFIFDNLFSHIVTKAQIKNLDLFPGKGIDYAGNILNDIFHQHLQKQHFDAIILCNVLEHVTDINELTKRIETLVKPEGYIIFSGPYQYPTHLDPIDNGFRPSVDEVSLLFKHSKIINAKIITDFSYSYYMLNNKKQFIMTIIRALLPFYKYQKWKRVVLPKFKWWNKQFKVTAVIFQKVR